MFNRFRLLTRALCGFFLGALLTASLHAADAPAGAASDGGANAMLQFLPLIAIVVLFYFLMIRPQQKKAKEHRAMLEELKQGDEVLTSSGLAGTLRRLNAGYVLLEVAPGTEILLQRHTIAGKLEKDTIRKERS